VHIDGASGGVGLVAPHLVEQAVARHQRTRQRISKRRMSNTLGCQLQRLPLPRRPEALEVDLEVVETVTGQDLAGLGLTAEARPDLRAPQSAPGHGEAAPP